MFQTAVARKSILDETAPIVKLLQRIVAALPADEILSGCDPLLNFFQAIYPAKPTGGFLRDHSPRHKLWDQHKDETSRVSGMLLQSRDERLKRWGLRALGCAEYIAFERVQSVDEPCKSTLKLKAAFLCHVRVCPLCQWRRSLMYTARFVEALPKIMKANLGARWLFLTVSSPCVPVNRLRETLGLQNEAWDRMSKRKNFDDVVRGVLRSTEVTRTKTGLAHPHFHSLLLVEPNYFESWNYITQSQWTEMWTEAMGLGCKLRVDIRTVKSKPGPGDKLMGSICEVLKYSVKPSDMLADPVWFCELARQIHKLRFVAGSGVFKGVLRENDESDKDMVPPEESDSNGVRSPALYGFDRPQGVYVETRIKGTTRPSMDVGVRSTATVN